MEKKMTLDDLYNHIIKHITPEKALRKFLEGSLIQYEKLKFEKEKEVHPLFIMSMAAIDMGWHIAIEKDKEDIEGITTGTEEYIKRHLGNDN